MMMIVIFTIPRRTGVGGFYKIYIIINWFVWWANKDKWIILILKVIEINFEEALGQQVKKLGEVYFYNYNN